MDTPSLEEMALEFALAIVSGEGIREASQPKHIKKIVEYAYALAEAFVDYDRAEALDKGIAGAPREKLNDE